MKISLRSRLFNFFLALCRKTRKTIQDLEKMRGQELWMAKLMKSKLEKLTAVEQVELGSIPVIRVCYAAQETSQTMAERKAFLLLHGGAYCLYPKSIYTSFLADFSQQLGADGYLPDYRLAPEHPHPAGIDDCFTAYQSLLGMGYQAKNIVVFGDSAGGGLLLSVLQKALKVDLPMPSCAVLSSPAGDWTLQGDSFFENDGIDPLFTLATILFFRSLYLNGHSPNDPDVSPCFGQYEGLPPLYICTSDTELMRDIAVDINDKAKAAGVKTTFTMFEKMCHDFAIMSFLPESRLVKKEMRLFIEQHLNG